MNSNGRRRQWKIVNGEWAGPWCVLPFTIFYSLFTSFAVIVPAHAAFNKEARGTTTANFLKLGTGARAIALGEAYSAAADDATSLFWNPAGLARIEHQTATLMYAPYLAETSYSYGAWGRRLGRRHAIGASVQYFSAGTLSETDANNASLGDFHPYDLAISAGYAYRFSHRLREEGWTAGAAVKWVQSKILATAQTATLDFGVQSRPFFDRLRLALSVANAGGSLKFEEESDPLPTTIRLGSAFQITDPWLVTFDLIMPRDNDPYAALGSEYRWRLSDQLGLAARAGYNGRAQGDVNGFTGVTLGGGLRYEAFDMDYALQPYGDLGLTHRISLSFRFGAGLARSDDSNAQMNFSSPIFFDVLD